MVEGDSSSGVSNSNTQGSKIKNWNKLRARLDFIEVLNKIEHVFSSLQIYNDKRFHMETNLSCLNIESGTSKA